MSAALDGGLRPSLWAAAVSVFTSSGTLVCCALPALLVSLGAGATLAGLVTTFPQLIWLSERKAAVFALAGAMLLVAGALQWRARSLPCPADARLAAACARTRRVSVAIYAVAVALYLTGALFAFVLPALL
jgi:hypothetical protein